METVPLSAETRAYHPAPDPVAESWPDLSGYSVLQVLPRLESGGVERGTVEMVAAIVAAGGTAWVASQGGRLEAAVKAAGGQHKTLPLASKNPWIMWRNRASLARLIKRERIDLVHARSRAPAWSALLAARARRKPFVTTFHGLYSENAPFKRLYNRVMAMGDRVIAISDAVAAHITARYHVPATKLRIIHRGVALDQFDPDHPGLPARAAELARQWRLPAQAERPFTILLPGRLTSWKGHALMLEALANITAPALLVIVGAGDAGYRAELDALIARWTLADRVIFAGDCADMPSAYALADLVVTPSQRPEAFGRTPVEAQAMRRPVIATAHGGALETVDPGATGWLVPPGDAEALASSVRTVMALPPAARQMIGQQARRAVEERFSATRMQMATLKVYLELLRK